MATRHFVVERAGMAEPRAATLTAGVLLSVEQGNPRDAQRRMGLRRGAGR
jgi:hypothetical protein